MTIEVKQLVIKSSVNDSSGGVHKEVESNIDLEEFKKELLAECRQIVSDSMRNVRER